MYEKRFRHALRACPDVHYGNGEHFADANVNTGISKWTLTGTTREGIRKEVQGCDFYTFRNGKVARKDSVLANHGVEAPRDYRTTNHGVLRIDPSDRRWTARRCDLSLQAKAFLAGRLGQGCLDAFAKGSFAPHFGRRRWPVGALAKSCHTDLGYKLLQTWKALADLGAIGEVRTHLMITSLLSQPPERKMDRKLAAILAADVVGYSAMMERDEAGTHERVRTGRKELFEPTIARHHGTIFKLMGDGMLAEFSSVVEAVECAVALQRGLAERNAALPQDQRIQVRIGVNLGEVIVEGNDRFGEGVNIAARLEQLAEPGGIWVSAKVAREVEKKLAFGFQAMGAAEGQEHRRAGRSLPGDDRRQSFAPAREPQPLANTRYGGLATCCPGHRMRAGLVAILRNQAPDTIRAAFPRSQCCRSRT